MTWGITVAPRMPDASRTLSVPEKVGTSRPWAMPDGEGSAWSIWKAKPTTITPTRQTMAASM